MEYKCLDILSHNSIFMFHFQPQESIHLLMYNLKCVPKLFAYWIHSFLKRSFFMNLYIQHSVTDETGVFCRFFFVLLLDNIASHRKASWNTKHLYCFWHTFIFVFFLLLILKICQTLDCLSVFMSVCHSIFLILFRSYGQLPWEKLSILLYLCSMSHSISASPSLKNYFF